MNSRSDDDALAFVTDQFRDPETFLDKSAGIICSTG